MSSVAGKGQVLVTEENESSSISSTSKYISGACNEIVSITDEENIQDKAKVISSRDADVTLEFLRQYDSEVPEITEEQEKRLSRKVVWIIVPLCALIDFALYADKATASYTSIFGMWKDTHLTQNMYNNSTTLFYVGFIVGQINLIFLQKLPVGQVMTALGFLWTLIIYLHTVAVNHQGIYALRFF